MDVLFYLLTSTIENSDEHIQINKTLIWLYDEIYITNAAVGNHMQIVKDFTNLRKTKHGRIVLFHTINDLKETSLSIYNEVYEFVIYLLDCDT
jgi:hypothetical protein